MSARRILVVGMVNIDVIVNPFVGEIEAEGGAGPYVAIAAAVHRGVAVSLLAAVCRDMPARFWKDIASMNIETDNLLPVLGNQRRARLEYDAQMRRNNTGMLQQAYQDATIEQMPRHLPVNTKHYDLVHIPPFTPTHQLQYAAWAKGAGMLVSMDTCEHHAEDFPDTLFSMLPFVDVFMPSEVELNLLIPSLAGNLDAMAARIVALGVRLLVVKQAERGCTIYDFQNKCKLRGGILPGASVVDATGAGDSYNGAFLASWLAGEKLADCVRYAAYVAAQCIGEIGYRGLLTLPAYKDTEPAGRIEICELPWQVKETDE